MDTFARVPVHVPGLVSVPTIKAPASFSSDIHRRTSI